jgi:hypothetical protein
MEGNQALMESDARPVMVGEKSLGRNGTSGVRTQKGRHIT